MSKTEAERIAMDRRMSMPANSNGKVMSAAREADEARAQLDGPLPLLADRARALRDEWLTDAALVVAGLLKDGQPHDAAIRGESNDRYKRALKEAEQQDDRFQRLERIIGEQRATVKLSVKSEPRTYGEGSPNSYFLDLARSSQPGSHLHREAVERLQRHAREVSVETSLGTDEGKRAIRSAQTRGRGWGGTEGSAREEVRALTTGSSSGAAFVTPQYLVEDWADYRTYGPAFVEQTTKVPDDGYGMQLNIPSITSAASVAQQTEGSAVTNSSSTGAYISSSLQTFAGEVDVSQILFDRSSPPGIDKIIHTQLTEQLWTAIDSYAIGQALSTAGSVSGASVWSNANFWGDLGHASSNMATAAGTVLSPTHLYMSPQWYQWATTQVDDQHRPLLTPHPDGAYRPVNPAPDGDSPCGYTGQRILNSQVFTDGNIAASGSNTQFILCNAANVYTLTSEPVTRAIPETFANDLTVAVQLYAVFGIVVRHATAVQVITGAGYPSAPTFA